MARSFPPFILLALAGCYSTNDKDPDPVDTATDTARDSATDTGPDCVEEVPYNGIDDDCDPDTPDDDLDGDGYPESEDCDDTNAEIYPGAEEHCDGVDEDCGEDGDAGSAEEQTFYEDADGDSYGNADSTTESCDPPDGYVEDNTDCDDTLESVNPGAEEECGNLIDDDCDGTMNDCEPVGELSVDECAAKILGFGTDQYTGYGFAVVGDLSGDGSPDLGIGAVGGAAGDGLGEVYLVDGQVEGTYDLSDPDGLGHTLGVFQGDTAWDLFGHYLDVGDVTGDGEIDLLVGAPYRLDATYGVCEMGAAYVFAGPLTDSEEARGVEDAAATIWGLETFISPTDGLPYCENDAMGFRLTAGDLTGDGVDDLISGSGWNSSTGSYGTAYVFDGPLSGEYTSWDAYTTVQSSEPDLDEWYYWQSVGWADLDGDGQADLIMANIGDDGDVENAGAAYIFYGPVLEGELDPADADAVIRGQTELGYFGTFVNNFSTDDFDDDGYTDLVIGAYGTTLYGEEAGAVYLFSGPLVGEISTEDATAIFYGENAGDEASDGGTMGDFNGDGIADLAIGSDGADLAGERSGAAYIFYGPLEGEHLVGDADFIIHGAAEGDEVGFWVAGFGDSDGDGFDDIAITAPFDDENGTDAGAVYVCRGSGW